MKNLFKWGFDKWWRPIFFLSVCCLTFGLSEIFRNRTFGNIAFLFVELGLVVVLVSSIYLFTQKKWLTGLFSLGVFGGTIVAFVFYAIALFWMEQERPDEWAKNLKIPTNIQLDNPVDIGFDEQKPDSITNRVVKQTDFQLYNSFQPGLYEFDFWTNQIESGTIYLKAFEITQEYALSTDRLPKRSSVKVSNPTDRIQKFGTTSHFTIYEGDWEQPYAARFEVWFKPDNGGQERKLLNKNYKIEGWMR
jgi:ABC-type multidrug transport system fused ATPase/permease subunit